MDTSKLVPNDPWVRRASGTVRGRTYEYAVGEPQGSPPVDTIFLIHGFPDLGFGWRCQVPYLVSLGFRVVVPDMLGYAGSHSPRDLREYSFESLSADIKELARIFVSDRQIILVGHDWGGFLVWRVPMWHPELVKAVFSVCTPFFAPTRTYVPLEDLIAAGKFTHFTYQLQFIGPDIQDAIQGEERVHQFLNAVHGGAGPNGEAGIRISKGVLFENLPKLRRTALLSEEELDHYVQQYMRQAARRCAGRSTGTARARSTGRRSFRWRTRKPHWTFRRSSSPRPTTPRCRHTCRPAWKRTFPG